MSTRVAVVHTGLSNVDSVVRAVERVGGSPSVARQASGLRQAARIVLPGVGSFAAGARALSDAGIVDELRDCAASGVPILGICLGMQLLASVGEEGGVTAGLGLIPGRVHRLEPTGAGERIPHMGWNEVEPTVQDPLFDGIEPSSDFYFVHSFHFEPDVAADELAVTPYCGGFTSAVRRGSVAGVQFHPEKSHGTGLRLLQNFVVGRGC